MFVRSVFSLSSYPAVNLLVDSPCYTCASCVPQTGQASGSGSKEGTEEEQRPDAETGHRCTMSISRCSFFIVVLSLACTACLGHLMHKLVDEGRLH